MSSFSENLNKPEKLSSDRSKIMLKVDSKTTEGRAMPILTPMVMRSLKRQEKLEVLIRRKNLQRIKRLLRDREQQARIHHYWTLNQWWQVKHSVKLVCNLKRILMSYQINSMKTWLKIRPQSLSNSSNGKTAILVSILNTRLRSHSMRDMGVHNNQQAWYHQEQPWI